MPRYGMPEVYHVVRIVVNHTRCMQVVFWKRKTVIRLTTWEFLFVFHMIAVCVKTRLVSKTFQSSLSLVKSAKRSDPLLHDIGTNIIVTEVFIYPHTMVAFIELYITYQRGAYNMKCAYTICRYTVLRPPLFISNKTCGLCGVRLGLTIRSYRRDCRGNSFDEFCHSK